MSRRPLRIGSRGRFRRLAATLVCDAKLQLRNGFYHAAAAVAVFWMVVLRLVPADQMRWLMPVCILSNLLIGTFYFVGGLVLLEKAEGTLLARAVAPLSSGEYVAGKVLTLVALALVENGLIVLVVLGPTFDPLALGLGIAVAAAFFVLTGILVVVRYDSINAYLFPSFLYTLLFVPPSLGYLGVWDHPLQYLHPLQASLVLLVAAFEPVPAWQWLYGLGYGALCVGLTFAWTGRVAARFGAIPEGAA